VDDARHGLSTDFEVLVIDDEAEIRDLMADYFTGLGFAVTRVSDGRAALVALERYPKRFGLIMTDVNMPGVDGFGVLAEARRLAPAAYVVIVTGYASLDSAIQAVRAGAYDYLPKPFALGQLDVILQRIGNHAALERAARRAPMVASGPPAGDGRSLETRLTAIERSLIRLEHLIQVAIAR
jgi:DNA-binding NtrC family response regulator